MFWWFQILITFGCSKWVGFHYKHRPLSEYAIFANEKLNEFMVQYFMCLLFKNTPLFGWSCTNIWFKWVVNVRNILLPIYGCSYFHNSSWFNTATIFYSVKLTWTYLKDIYKINVSKSQQNEIRYSKWCYSLKWINILHNFSNSILK